jgi:hypothetical protein
MNEHGKSDRPIVPGKSPNKARASAAEEMEGRGLAKGNLSQQNAFRTQSRVSRAKRAGADTTNGKIEQGCEVHRSDASHLPDRHPAVCLLRS